MTTGCRPNHYGDRPCGGFGERCDCDPLDYEAAYRERLERDKEAELSESIRTDPSNQPGPAFIPRETDEKPSEAMPQAGFRDWREQAEWWERTCGYWHSVAHGGNQS